VRIELNGVVLAESRSPVMVFETGLPTRHYLDRADVDLTHLVVSDTVTSMPVQEHHKRILVCHPNSR
jgi:uncharacterized protein (DUF427 family)